MSKTIVEFKDVVKTYGSGDALLYAVNHIDFKIEEGEFVVILGQSINCMFDTDSFPGIV